MVVVLLVLLVTVAVASDEEACYARNTRPYLNFSSKTSYEFVYNKDGIPEQPQCRAVRLWALCRHGTRWPGRKQYAAFRRLADIRDRIVQNQGEHLCPADLDNLHNFEFSVAESEANLLTEQGGREMRRLGRRLATRFPHLFATPYSPLSGKYILWHDETTRTRQSALAFAEGAFGRDIDASLPDTNHTIISLIHPYKRCRAWQEGGQAESERLQRQFDADTPHMRSLVASVGSRLNLTLTQDDVLAMYEGCRYEKAWRPEGVSPWCTAFTTAHLQVLEYRKDMSEWYRSGPGSPPSHRLACPLVADLTRWMAEEEGMGAGAVVYFSHDTMLRMVAARLGLASLDLPPTPHNMADQAGRAWRISLLAPFAANFIAVLYNCSDGLSVGLHVQERALEWPGCGGRVLCPLSRLLSLHHTSCQDEDLSFCDAPPSSDHWTSPLAFSLALLLVSVAAFLRFCY